jgi:hypothetical protein
LTAQILPGNSPYLDETADFVQHELIIANAGYHLIPAYRGCAVTAPNILREAKLTS